MDELIKAGADVNVISRNGDTALLTAVTEHKRKLVKRLLDAGADVNVKGRVICGDISQPEMDEKGGVVEFHVPRTPIAEDSSPLIVAVRRGYADIAALLIKAGADLEGTDRDGFTALAHAQRRNSLPAAEAELSSADQEFFAPHIRALKRNNEKIVKLLLDAGAKPPKYPEGSPGAAWLTAAVQGNCESLQKLMAEGLDVNTKVRKDNGSQRTALMEAAENGQLEAVQLLIRAGARVDEQCGQSWEDDQNRTALMHAIEAGDCQIVQALLNAGASASIEDGDGRTPLHYAAERGDVDLIRMLVKAGAKVDASKKEGTPLGEAVAHVNAVKALLELGADPNPTTRDGFTPLFVAAQEGCVETVKTLLEAGARAPVKGRLSPLEAASAEGHDEIVKLLLKGEASAKGATKFAKGAPAALVNAAFFGKTAVVRSLLKAGADPNQANEDQFTPLMAAVRGENLELVHIFLNAGAEVNATNDEGLTALDLAFDNIKAVKDQAHFLESMGKMEAETRKAVGQIKKMGKEDEITRMLAEAGGKRATDLKGAKKPIVPEPEPNLEQEPEVPDFSEAAKAASFQEAIKEVAQLCNYNPRPLSNEEGDSLAGCVFFRVSTERCEDIIRKHHESLLTRGCYLFRKKRGYTSGKDELALLPTRDWRLVLQANQTNGANCGLYTEDIIAWLEKLEKEQPFLLTGAGFDWCEGRFTTPIKNAPKLAKAMYKFCPDIVDQGIGDVGSLATELKKKQRFFFWWD
ncbi:MAG: hypothetical protein C5B50_14510 [Verrucomicrobia bacterium]|nr:MAG: hypothetical protein C5B50_14510 [Verrucomicrobiota bacterium]